MGSDRQGPGSVWDFPKVLSFLNPTRAAAVAITRRPAPGKVVARTGKAEMPLCEGLSVRGRLGRRERQVQQYRIEVVNKFARDMARPADDGCRAWLERTR